MFSEGVDLAEKDICLEISKGYEMQFLEIGTNKNWTHFLVQSVPTYSVTKIIRMITNITAREIFRTHPEVEELLWDGESWNDGYFVNTVSRFGNENSISQYV